MKILLFLSVVVIVILPLATGQSSCPLPTVADIERELTVLLLNADTGGGPYDPTVSSHQYTCLAQGSTRDTYRRVSIIATFTSKSGQSQQTQHFQLECSIGTWNAITNFGFNTPPSNSTERTDCFNCAPENLGGDSNHCLSCNSACNYGSGRCLSNSPVVCCPFFGLDNMCTTSCPTNYVASANTNFTCVCNYTCGPGKVANATCNGCNLTDICQRDMPCQNGGSCILLSVPDNYTCNCSGTGYTGTNCIGPPVITPSGSVIVLHGNDLLVKCEASGNILSYQWLDSNGVIITTSNTSPLLLNITNVTQSDSGTHICKVIYTNLTTDNSSIFIIVEDGWSTSASSHIIGALPILNKNDLSLIITTVENKPVNFTVKNLAGTISSGSVTSNVPTTVTLDLTNTVDSRTDREKGIIVSTGSYKKISVFVAGRGIFTAGVYQSYPTWGYPVNEYVYYAISTSSNTVGSFSTLLLVSANNDTIITITPTVNITIPRDLSPTGIDLMISGGNSVTIQLDYLQTFLIKSTNDLTGSKVISNKPIAVYSGHTCGEEPLGQGCDFLVEQIPPSASWGYSFLVSPFSTRTSGYLLKFISSQSNTNINISCQSNIIHKISLLQEDATASQLITGRSICHIYANNPILVAQISLGYGADFIPGDPGVVIVPPFQHYVASTVFPAITLLSSTKYMNLAVISSNFNSSQVLLNGESLGSQTWTKINTDDGSSVVVYVLAGYFLLSDINNVTYQDPNARLCPLIFGSYYFVGYTYTGGLNMIPHRHEEITPSTPPSIDLSINPTPLLAVINGNTAVLNCSASGNPPPTVHWIFRGSNITNDTVKYIITNGVLTILNVELNDAGDYHCTASIVYRSVRGTIELKVQVPPFFINVLSTKTNGILGGNMSLNCTAYGVPRPSVTWRKNNEHISSPSSGITIINDNMTAHQVTSYLILSDISHNDSGIYHCNASNELVEVKSIISSGRVYILSPPSLVKGFVNITKNQSDTVQLSCVFSGQPVPQVTWSRSQNNADKEELDNRTNKITVTSSSNDTTVVSTLKINDIEKTDEGNYICNASNGIPNLIQSQEYNKAFITVQVPPTVQPVSKKVIGLLNEPVTISFTITNDLPKVKVYNIQWQFKPLDSETFNSINSELLSENHLSLTISNVQLSNRGSYKMLAQNEAGISEATVVLDVYVTAALWNNTGGTVIKIKGQNVVFNCTADGLPRPTIVWRKNGQLLLNASRLKIISSEQTNDFRSNIIPEVLQRTNMLEITDLKGNDNGSYSCRADNEANLGVVLTTPFTLHVIEPPPTNYCLSSPCGKNGKCHSLSNGYLCDCNDGYTGINCEQVVVVSVPPQITQPPKNTSGNLYSTTNLTCKATGSPIPTILWYKNDVLISNDNSDPSVLLFSELDLSDRGFYHCEARSIIDGKNVFTVSSRVLLNITNVVQYEAKIELPDDFYEKSNLSISDRISDLIDKSNNYLTGSQLSNTSNTSFFFIQFFNASNFSYTAQVHTIPIVITLVTKSGASEKLRNGIQHQMAMLGRQLSVNISIAEVDRFDGCPSAKTIIPSHSGKQNLELILLWPETNIGGEARVSCPCGNGSSGGQILQASRYCGGDFTRGAEWSKGNIAACNFSDLAREICQLRNLPVAEKVVRLENLTSNSDVLGSTEVTASVSVLVTATEGVSGNITLTTTFLEVVDNILDVNQDTLQTSQETSNTSAKILEAIESVVENIPLTNTSEPVVISQKSFAVSVQQVDIEEFKESGQTFSVNFGDFSNNNQSLNSNDLTFGGSNQQSTASINLPRNLLNGLPNTTNNTRITHSVFITDSLFLRRVDNFQEVGSIILSATVVGTDTIRGLNPPVGLSFMINPNINGSSPQCSFWNQSLDDGFGDWSSKGCRNITKNETEVICECNHLTSFAILLDVSVTVEPTERTGLTLFLDAVTYIGIIVSLFCLIITIISYLSNKKLRTSDHGQLLLNLCFALMGLYITFIFAIHSRDVPGLCAVTGAVLQYFFLVTFMVMAADAINLYMNLVIVLGQKISHFVLKATITSWRWGIGLLATQDIHTNKTVRDLLAALFVIITAFHGLLIFIMHCLRSKEVRYTWKRCFFGVTGKDISEFSSSFSLKQQRRVQTSSRFTMKSPASPEKSSGVFVYDDSTLRRSYGDPGDSGTLRFHTEKEEKRENEQVIAAINLKSIERGTESVTDPEGSAFPETSFTKSFPDDEEDEKEKLRREEEEEYKLRNQSTTVQES